MTNLYTFEFTSNGFKKIDRNHAKTKEEAIEKFKSCHWYFSDLKLIDTKRSAVL